MLLQESYLKKEVPKQKKQLTTFEWQNYTGIRWIIINRTISTGKSHTAITTKKCEMAKNSNDSIVCLIPIPTEPNTPNMCYPVVVELNTPFQKMTFLQINFDIDTGTSVFK